MSDENFCPVCLEPSKLKCGRCRRVVYCCKEHQKSHWKIHKEKCLQENFKLVKDESGFHLVALTPIPEGKTVLMEKALLVMTGIGLPACFGCNTLFKTVKFCTLCGLPVCSRACEKSDLHKPECEVTVKYRRSKFSLKGMNRALAWASLYLRFAYLKSNNKNAWSNIINLKKSSKECNDFNNLVEMVASSLERNFGYKHFTRKELSQILGIFQVNFYSTSVSKVLFHQASYLEHNCNPNCCWVITEDSNIVVRAIRDIKEGENISVMHLRSAADFMNKSLALQRRNLVCTCELCKSPTEPDCHLESLICLTPACPGYIVPYLLPHTSNYVWKCFKCQYTLKEDNWKYYISLVENVEIDFDNDHVALSNILKRLLHPSNLVFIMVKVSTLANISILLSRCMSNKELIKFFEIWLDLNNAPPRFLNQNFYLRVSLFVLRLKLLEEIILRSSSTFGVVVGGRMIASLLHNIVETADSLLKFEVKSSDEEKLMSDVQKFKNNPDFVHKINCFKEWLAFGKSFFSL